MSSPIKPMAHYVVAVKEKKPEKTASGIFLPESAQEKSEAAKVVAVGSAVKDVADGARVVYKNYADQTKHNIPSLSSYEAIWQKKIRYS